MQRFVPRHGWGPRSRRAAIAISFDNLGEAAELEGGMWGDRPVGRHYTADFVPQLVDLLGDVRATYFMEASNVALYPGAMAQWHRAGHEIGLHGWRHETWGRCEPGRRRSLLADSMAALRSLGVVPTGFRPPGGDFPADAWPELREVGITYCSGLGAPGDVRHAGGATWLPFDWRSVDAYMLEPLFAGLRSDHGDRTEPFAIDEWSAVLADALAAALRDGGQHTFVFHSMFLAHAEAKREALRGLLRRARDADVWIAPLNEIAAFVANESAVLAAEAGVASASY